MCHPIWALQEKWEAPPSRSARGYPSHTCAARAFCPRHRRGARRRLQILSLLFSSIPLTLAAQMNQFLTEDLQPVMDLDSTTTSHPVVQSVSHPDEITEIFDTISYNKVYANVVSCIEKGGLRSTRARGEKQKGQARCRFPSPTVGTKYIRPARLLSFQEPRQTSFPLSYMAVPRKKADQRPS